MGALTMPLSTNEGRGAAWTILVVDDEPALLRLMEFMLRREGYTLLTATNGDEAIEVIYERRPDLIILDIMMPKRDGYQVTEMIRSSDDPAITSIPIVMLSAKAQDEDIVRGREMGVEEYITKPFEPEHLASVVAGILRDREAGGPAAAATAGR